MEKSNLDLKMTAEIDLMKNATYYVKDGVLEEVDPLPYGHGSQTVVWQPVGFDINYTKRSR